MLQIKKMSLKAKLLGLGIVMTAVPLLAIYVVVHAQNARVSAVAQQESRKLAYADLDHIAQGIYGMCLSQQELLEQKLQSDASVARAILAAHGAISFDDDQAEWVATNQFTKSATRLSLPQMIVGTQWLGQNAASDRPSPIVDEVQRLVGGTATIFQRMNTAGDMLRVATNVKTLDGKRAIGTYIPAVNPDGQPNPVVSALLSGTPYTGRAYVVNGWYLTTYLPLRDETRQVVGALYVGVPQESVKSLREQIMATTVGTTGYVYVLDTQGHYVISKDGKRDGENIWEAKDADGRLFIQEIISKAVDLEPGEIAEATYPWKNQGDKDARVKIARIMHFAPWDWVIGVGSYEEEFRRAEQLISEVAVHNRTLLLSITGASLLLAVILWMLIARNIAGALNRIAENLTSGAEQTSAAAGEVSAASQSLAEGASEQAASLEEISSSVEEMAAMTKQNADNANDAKALAAAAQASADEGAEAMGRMNGAIQDIKRSSDETGKIVKTIDEIAFQTNLLALNAAVEAARAGEAGKGFAVVAEEVRNLAQRSAQAAKETAEMLAESVHKAENGATLSREVLSFLEAIAAGNHKVNTLITEIAAAGREQAQGLEQISTAVGQMDQVTQSTAASAEESASASEELAAQADTLNGMVNDLLGVVGGSSAPRPAADPTDSDQAADRRPARGRRLDAAVLGWQSSAKPVPAPRRAVKGKSAPAAIEF
ncbi:MAG: methyl-accepting chemotaxis protein [Desulfobacterales bacterium]